MYEIYVAQHIKLRFLYKLYCVNLNLTGIRKKKEIKKLLKQMINDVFVEQKI